MNYSQTGVQVQTQVQTLTPQQLLVARLTEMPIEALAERIDIELKENPTLSTQSDNDSYDADSAHSATSDEAGDSYADDSTLDDYSTEAASLADQRADYSNPDDIPDNQPTTSRRGIIDAIDGEAQSFYDQLEEQTGLFNLTEHQQQLIHYIIGSLDDDGLLRVSLTQIKDELEVYHNIITNETELESVLSILQNFEPAGVGARSLQECLILQVRHSAQRDTAMREEMLTLLQKNFDLLMLRRWDKIKARMHLTDAQTARLQHEVRRLNPRPGSSMGEAVGRNIQQITPDFIVETDPYGNITMTLNEPNVPTLIVSPEDQTLLTQLEEQNKQQTTQSRSQREGLTYIRQRVDKARGFIEAIQQRRRNLTATMKAIIQLQRPYFETGDETLLRPMTLDDVAGLTSLHISTVSRVSASKWVQTNYGIMPLKWFFTTAARKDGDDVSVRHIKATIKELIDAEDKTNPLPDDTLTEMLRQKGYDVARRTVAKYRTQIGFPVARLRKSFLNN